MADNPWAGIQNIGAIDQKLYQQPKKEEAQPVPSSEQNLPIEEKQAAKQPAVKTQKVAIKSKSVEQKEKQLQLNSWIKSSQNNLLDQIYFGLRAKGIKLKKGELVGAGIEIVAAILERYTPRTWLRSKPSYWTRGPRRGTK